MGCEARGPGAIARKMRGTDPNPTSRLPIAVWLRTALLCLTTWPMVCAAGAQEPIVPPDSRFVMSFFKANGGGGDERLFISVSPDGQNWTALNGGQPVWQHPLWPTYVVRDPTIVYH